ncbi:hypothetical protein Tco_0031777 [Tanacetum coccineum]
MSKKESALPGSLANYYIFGLCLWDRSSLEYSNLVEFEVRHRTEFPGKSNSLFLLVFPFFREIRGACALRTRKSEGGGNLSVIWKSLEFSLAYGYGPAGEGVSVEEVNTAGIFKDCIRGRNFLNFLTSEPLDLELEYYKFFGGKAKSLGAVSVEGAVDNLLERGPLEICLILLSTKRKEIGSYAGGGLFDPGKSNTVGPRVQDELPSSVGLDSLAQ